MAIYHDILRAIYDIGSADPFEAANLDEVRTKSGANDKEMRSGLALFARDNLLAPLRDDGTVGLSFVGLERVRNLKPIAAS
jgi:hypothetical protein